MVEVFNQLTSDKRSEEMCNFWTGTASSLWPSSEMNYHSSRAYSKNEFDVFFTKMQNALPVSLPSYQRTTVDYVRIVIKFVFELKDEISHRSTSAEEE